MTKEILLIDPSFQKFMGFSKSGIPIGLLSLAGEVPRQKILEFMQFADTYNHNSRKAREMYNC